MLESGFHNPNLREPMHTLSLLLIGFSVFGAFILASTHFRDEPYRGQPIPQSMGILLLLALVGLQLGHFVYLDQHSDFVFGPVYRALLFVVAPTFYLASKPWLEARLDLRPIQLLHLTPVIVAPFLPFSLALPLAFAIGSAYVLWLAKSVYALRTQRSQFQWAFWVLVTAFVLAIGVLVVGLGAPLMSTTLFFELYASAIGMAFLLAGFALGRTPQFLNDVADAARATYVSSTLAQIDCPMMLKQLAQLMSEERIYEQADLTLPLLAARMDISPHQLSELINVHLGKGFSRYVREYRVEAAKALLLSKPAMSVLAVGMQVGFSSQSNFYEAFRELAGMTPGQFRKMNKAATSE
jgi:AraC-like DNA-binding protein